MKRTGGKDQRYHVRRVFWHGSLLRSQRRSDAHLTMVSYDFLLLESYMVHRGRMGGRIFSWDHTITSSSAQSVGECHGDTPEAVQYIGVFRI